MTKRALRRQNTAAHTQSCGGSCLQRGPLPGSSSLPEHHTNTSLGSPPATLPTNSPRIRSHRPSLVHGQLPAAVCPLFLLRGMFPAACTCPRRRHRAEQPICKQRAAVQAQPSVPAVIKGNTKLIILISDAHPRNWEKAREGGREGGG